MKKIKQQAPLPFLAMLLFGCSGDGGTEVIITNAGSTPVHSAVVRVTGNSYALGEIDSRQTRSVHVYPGGESHVEIEHVATDGTKKLLFSDCYFEKGYCGTIEAKVTTDSVVDLKYDKGP
jgi:hypothetical protein